MSNESKSTRSSNGIPLSRRNLMVGGGFVAFSGIAAAFSRRAQAQEFDVSTIKSVVFDVIGTTADYWSAFVAEGDALNREKGVSVNWSSIITAWHPLDPPGFADILAGHRQWQSPSSLRLDALQKTVEEQAPGFFSRDEIVALNTVWQRMELWPDTLSGLMRLKQRYTLATLSNADMSDMVKLAKLRGLPWDLIMTSELAQTVKPSPRVYQLAPLYLGLRPEEILMVACHKLDLHAARAVGLKTAFVPRPFEKGPNGKVDVSPDTEFDLNAESFDKLAELLKA